MKSPSFKVADAFSFAGAHGLQAEAAQIQSMEVHPTLKAPNVVRKGYLVELFEARGLMEAFVEQYWTTATIRTLFAHSTLCRKNEHRGVY